MEKLMPTDPRKFPTWGISSREFVAVFVDYQLSDV